MKKKFVLVRERLFVLFIGLFFSTFSWGTSVPCGGETFYSLDPGCFGTWFITQPDGSIIGPAFAHTITATWGDTPGIGSVSVEYYCEAGDPPITETYYVIIGNGRLERPIVSAPNHACNNSTFTLSVVPNELAVDYTYSVPFGWKINGMALGSLTTTATSVSITSPMYGAGLGVLNVVANGDDCTLNSFNGSTFVAYGVQTPDLSGPTTVSSGGPTHYFVEDYNYTDIEWVYPADWGVIGPYDSEIYIDLAATSPAGAYPIRFNANLCGTAVTNLVTTEVTGGGGSGGGVIVDEFTPEGMPEHEGSSISALSGGKLDINLYPNPSNGQVTVQLPQSNLAYQLCVYDIAGQMVYTKESVTNQTTLDLSLLPKGHYVITANNTTNSFVEQLVIQ